MNDTRLDFTKRKQEVEAYFSFLMLLADEEHTRIKYRKAGRPVEESISGQLQKILIANGFLLLYNVIEATVRNSILEIYFEIQDQNIEFEILSEKLKKIWIKQETDSLKEGTVKQDTLRNKIFDIAETVWKKEVIVFSEKSLDFSGNLDAQKVRELAERYGFRTPPDGRNLFIIKNKRNRLAHGEATFSTIGSDFSVGDLNTFKDETFAFLSDVIEKIEEFIGDRKYIERP